MRTTLRLAAVAAAMLAGTAAHADPSGPVTVWSWNVAADALRAAVPGFNKKFPNVQVTVQDFGGQPTVDRTLAGCAAGGTDLPDVVQMENHKAETYWARFPDCFRDLKVMAPDEGALLKRFPAFKLDELTVGDKVFAMPYDSGPVVIFYRRDMYQKAGVDPDSLDTWDKFIEAGKKVVSANGGAKVVSTNADTGWFRMLANQAGCGYFAKDGQSITVAKPGCVQALETVIKIQKAGLFLDADWGGTLQAIKANTVAGTMFGGWYEGSIRGNAPEEAGKWGVFKMPALTAGGNRTANIGGSALAITQVAKNPEAALAFINYALGTAEGQVTLLKSAGQVPTLQEAMKDPFISQPQPYWGGQKVWQLVLSTLPDIKPMRGTQFFAEADPVVLQVVTDALNGKVTDVKASLDEAAQQIAGVTGLPVAQ